MKLQEKKMINAILFFANKSSNYKINRLKLMKLLWLADRIHLNRYGRLILKDNYVAMPHGPVPTKTMDISKENQDDVLNVENYIIQAEDKFDPKYFSQSDLDVLEEVWENYGDLNQFQLKDISHFFPEWKRFEEQLNNEDTPNSFPMELEDFFKSPDDMEDFPYDKERSKLTKNIYFSHKTIQEALNR